MLAVGPMYLAISATVPLRKCKIFSLTPGSVLLCTVPHGTTA